MASMAILQDDILSTSASIVTIDEQSAAVNIYHGTNIQQELIAIIIKRPPKQNSDQFWPVPSVVRAEIPTASSKIANINASTSGSTGNNVQASPRQAFGMLKYKRSAITFLFFWFYANSLLNPFLYAMTQRQIARYYKKLLRNAFICVR